jgi:hypothetical protein
MIRLSCGVGLLSLLLTQAWAGEYIPIPDSNWPGDSDFIMPRLPAPPVGGVTDCRYCYHGDGSIVPECKMREPPTCEQRMREVMKAMDRILSMPIVENKRFKTLPLVQWRATMKDCVEGK